MIKERLFVLQIGRTASPAIGVPLKSQNWLGLNSQEFKTDDCIKAKRNGMKNWVSELQGRVCASHLCCICTVKLILKNRAKVKKKKKRP